MWAAPLAFGSLFQVRIETDKMVGSRASIAKNDLTTLLTDFTIILVVSLKTNSIHNYQSCEPNLGKFKF